jgi:hypothetical protein
MQTAQDTPSVEERSTKLRSRLTNGAELLPGIDGRSATARRYKDLVGAISSDQGGAEHLSEARTQLVRRFAAASCLAENMEAKLVRGEAIDLQEFALLCSTLVRLGQRIGIDRRSRNVTPHLRDYLDAAVEDDEDGPT